VGGSARKRVFSFSEGESEEWPFTVLPNVENPKGGKRKGEGGTVTMSPSAKEEGRENQHLNHAPGKIAYKKKKKKRFPAREEGKKKRDFMESRVKENQKKKREKRGA